MLCIKKVNLEGYHCVVVEKKWQDFFIFQVLEAYAAGKSVEYIYEVANLEEIDY